MSNWGNVHVHSHYSALDGMGSVSNIVEKAVQMGQPFIGLSDHGNIAGAVSLYTNAKRLGIVPFVGAEMYLLDPYAALEDKNAGRYHLVLHALTHDGYKALVGLVSASYTRPRFSRFPRITLDDLAELSADHQHDIALFTGCYFGLAQQMLVREGPSRAERVVKMYAKWFPHTFVEVQHHNICHDNDNEQQPLNDDEIVTQMFSIGQAVGLPVIATQDSHYLDQRDRKSHNLMKKMVYGGADDAFPGDSFHFASADWVSEHYEERHWQKIEEASEHLLSLNELAIPPLDKFKAHVPNLTTKPLVKMKRLCVEALEKYKPSGTRGRTKYDDRLLYELDVIGSLDMAGYFLLVRHYVEWCQEKHICVEARGSANASLVCFLLGIHQVDPLLWGLSEHSFDRFLSKDRIKPPDIDMDVEDVERDNVIAYLRRNFDILNIGSWAKLGTNDDGTGSVLVTYRSYLTRDVKDKNQRAAIYAGMQSLEDVYRKSPADYRALKRMAEAGTVYKSYGVHASGLLLSGDDQSISDYVPSMLVASSNTVVSQFDQDDVEQLGYLKLDVLGQATLTTMRLCQEMIGREDPSDFTWIPLDDTKACAILREGRTDNGIFHFEGWTKARGGKQLGIRSTKDAVLAQALFMPGAMGTGQTDTYIARRKDTEKRRSVRYIHPVFESVLKETYGAVVFQEQVIAIMRGLGMSVEGVNTFFKIVKSSGSGAVEANNERIAKVRQEFNDLCLSAGIAESDIDTAWQSTAGFVAYGFNRCITGDTLLIRSSGNQYQPREVRVDQLYSDWHSNKPVGTKYRRQGVKVLAHRDGRIVQDTVIGVYNQGRQSVYTMTLANGRSITSTLSHRHLTDSGWVELGDIGVGTMIATIGEREAWSSPAGSKAPVGKHNGRHLLYRQLRAIGQCEWCESTSNLEIAHLNHDRTDNTRENLRLLCNSCHKQHDWDTGRRKVRHSRGRPVEWSPVVSITYAGEQDTYDVEMAGENHSWVGNGIITHNSHATGYGLRSYRCAYLKAHHPLEFMTALLQTWAGRDKEKVYVREARRIGIRILPPDVNISTDTWTLDKRRKAIRRGLVSIKGVGGGAARSIAENAPYTDIEDLILRTDSGLVTGGRDWAKKGTLIGVLKILREASALESIGLEPLGD